MTNSLRPLAYASAGLAWGAVAWLLGHRAFGPEIWAGVLAGPIIGVVVGLAMQKRFEEAGPGGRKVIALVSLYASALIFGVAIGLYQWMGPGARGLPAALSEGVISVLWGVTMTGFVIALWPLAYLTHRVLAGGGTPAVER